MSFGIELMELLTAAVVLSAAAPLFKKSLNMPIGHILIKVCSDNYVVRA